MDAPVLASVKIAKNAQLVTVIKYIYFGIEGALGSINIFMIFEDLRISYLKLIPPSTVSLSYNKSIKVFLKITPIAFGALGQGLEHYRPDHL